MSYIRINAKVSMMSDAEVLRRREELYQTPPSSSEPHRQAMYMELGLIEQRVTDVCAPLRLPSPPLGEQRPSVRTAAPFRWALRPSF